MRPLPKFNWPGDPPPEDLVRKSWKDYQDRVGHMTRRRSRAAIKEFVMNWPEPPTFGDSGMCLSIQSPHAEHVVRGLKIYELRKTHLQPRYLNTRVAIYESKTKSFLGLDCPPGRGAIIGSIVFTDSKPVTKQEFFSEEFAAAAALPARALSQAWEKGYRFKWVCARPRAFLRPLSKERFLVNERAGQVMAKVKPDKRVY
jgi:hypothetical protein